MATGTATCPFCQHYTAHPYHYNGRAYTVGNPVHGELETDHAILLRHRDESGDEQVEVQPGVFVSRPKVVQLDLGLGGAVVKTPDPATLRPIFYHNCPVAGHMITLYADEVSQ